MKVTLNICDALLYDALRVMLSELGHTVVDEGSEVILTDNQALNVHGGVVYIGFDKPQKAGGVYIRRPFLKEELDGALNAFSTTESKRGISIDKKRGALIFDGERIALTEKEMLLFCLLYENRGKAVSDETILEKVWKNETAQGSNIVAVYVKYLRSKLNEKVGRRLVFRVRGTGYILKLNEKE